MQIIHPYAHSVLMVWYSLTHSASYALPIAPNASTRYRLGSTSVLHAKTPTIYISQGVVHARLDVLHVHS